MKFTLAILLLALAAPNISQGQQQNQIADPTKVFRVAAPSIVTIMVNADSIKRQGSGVAVGVKYEGKQKLAGTWIATNAHVVSGINLKLNVIETARSWPATVEYLDDGSDLAILYVEGLLLPLLKPYGAKSLETGARVFAIGTPLGLDRSLSEGLVSGVRSRDKVALIQTTAAISPGSSGGALVDEAGRLVGITTFKLREGESLNFAVDATRVEQIQDALAAAALFKAVYLRRVVRAASEEEKDVQYIESNALTKWMLETRRPDGSPTYKWFTNRLLASMQTSNKFWGGNPDFDSFEAEFLATRQKNGVVQANSDSAGSVRLTCKMHATGDGSYQFDLNAFFDPARGTINGLPAKITSEEIVFRTGKDGAFTASVNRFSMRAQISSEVRPNLLNGNCVRIEERKF
jgi:hypothetical protein